MFHFVRKWSPGLERNQSRDLLRFILCRLYDEGRGKLVGSQLTLAQGTLARKLGLSRQWVGILLSRLEAAGWIDYTAPYVETRMQASTTFRIGRQLKRLLVMLAKGRPRKKPRKTAANERWQFSPSKELKKLLFIQEKEQEPLSPETLRRIPLLEIWLKRGGET